MFFISTFGKSEIDCFFFKEDKYLWITLSLFVSPTPSQFLLCSPTPTPPSPPPNPCPATVSISSPSCPLLSSSFLSSCPLYPSLPFPFNLSPRTPPPLFSFTHLPPSHTLHPIGTPPSPLGSSISSSPPPVSPPSPWLVSTAVVSEGQMTGELAPGRALSHPGAIRLVANNRCFRPGEDQSGGIMGNVQSSAFYTSAQMDEITLVSF